MELFCLFYDKGPVDGTGVSIKRSLRNAVLKQKYIVTNSSEFVSAAHNQPSKINVLEMNTAEITSADIEMRSKNLNLSKAFIQAPLNENIKLVYH